jgi:hypothetical protein
MAEPEFLGRLMKLEGGHNGPNASIWSSSPMLGFLPRQRFHGRVAVEVWDEGELAFHPSFPGDPARTAALLERAAAALLKSEVPIATETPWSDRPALEELAGRQFLGRVVVELWERDVHVAIAGRGDAAHLAQRAGDRLRRESADELAS